jgi:chromatin segregation and condensation protein Rec8/ScpA/Scc1 (kleisin family)
LCAYLNSIEDKEEENRQTKELIERLHKYNEYKDVAQALIGRFAVLEGCITRELYPRFDLELDD